MRLKDMRQYIAWGFSLLFIYALISSNNVYAFTKLQTGFVNLMSNHLLPLIDAVGGTMFIYYAIGSLVKPEEYLKKMYTTMTVIILAHTGDEIITAVRTSFT